MRRGEIWIVGGGSGYAAKPRPVVIIQDDRFDATDSVTICGFTTDPTEAPLIRIPTEPTERNGLRELSNVMVDKVSNVRRDQLGSRVGVLDDESMVRVGQAIVVFLGLAG
ncbi:MAG: type II toxin-antitoxin system PemK/MazF family toxin [Candidatus Dormibacteraceae bacterium]